MAKELIYATALALSATYVDTYKKANKVKGGAPSTNFIYSLSGGAEALARYKEIKDKTGHFREDENGKPLFFTNVHQGDTMEVTITRTGATIVRNNELDQMQSRLQLATDPAVRAAAANIIAMQMFGGLAQQPVAQPTVAPVAMAPVVDTEIEVDEAPPVSAKAGKADLPK